MPGVFTVERHIRDKWACAQCETITLAPVESHVIDKGILTTGLLARVLVAKYADHLPYPCTARKLYLHAPVWSFPARLWRSGSDSGRHGPETIPVTAWMTGARIDKNSHPCQSDKTYLFPMARCQIKAESLSITPVTGFDRQITFPMSR